MNVIFITALCWIISDPLSSFVPQMPVTLAPVGMAFIILYVLMCSSSKKLSLSLPILGILGYTLYSLTHTTNITISLALTINVTCYLAIVLYYSNKHTFLKDYKTFGIYFIPMQLLIQLAQALQPTKFPYAALVLGHKTYYKNEMIVTNTFNIDLPGLLRDSSYAGYLLVSILVTALLCYKANKVNNVRLPALNKYFFAAGCLSLTLTSCLPAISILVLALVSFTGISTKVLYLINLIFKKLDIGKLLLLTLFSILLSAVAWLAIKSFLDTAATSNQHRLANILIAKELFLQHPIFGSGYGSFERLSASIDLTNILPHISHIIKSKGYLYSHNLFATSAAEGGIISLVFISLFLFRPQPNVFAHDKNLYLYDLIIISAAFTYGHRLDTFFLLFCDFPRILKWQNQ